MSKNYLTFPMKYMTVTQSYTGTVSHLPHTTAKDNKDYPLDLGGYDSGRDYMYCPCDKIAVVRIYGVGSKGTNTVWLQSKEKVVFADGTEDYVTLMCIHPNDDDLKKLEVGQTFKRGEKMFREGSDGATANHIHIAVGKGMLGKNKGWIKNANGKWVLTTTNGTIKPEKAFYIDKAFTTVKKTNGLKFKDLPTETESLPKPAEVNDPQKTKIETAKSKDVKLKGTYHTTAKLNLRAGAGSDKKIILELPKGVTVQNYGYFTKATDGTVWLYITYGGKEGFAVSKYLKKE